MHERRIAIFLFAALYSPFSGQFGCGSGGWTRAGQSCYFIGQGREQNWTEARSACLSAKADLIKIDDDMEWFWLSKVMQFSGGWTGACFSEGEWRWTDDTPVDEKYLNWHIEPREHTQSYGEVHGLCATFDREGYYRAENCRYTAYHICEVRVKDQLECPLGWLYYNLSCYFAEESFDDTWRQAKLQCQTEAGKKGYLFIPSYRGEADFVVSKLIENEPEWPKQYWTGLTEGRTGVWGQEYRGYHYHMDLTHLKWYRAPSNLPPKDNKKLCVGVHRGSHLMADYYVDNKLKPICERALGSTKAKTAKLTGTTGQSMIVGNLFMIISLQSALAFLL